MPQDWYEYQRSAGGGWPANPLTPAVMCKLTQVTAQIAVGTAWAPGTPTPATNARRAAVGHCQPPNVPAYFKNEDLPLVPRERLVGHLDKLPKRGLLGTFATGTVRSCTPLTEGKVSWGLRLAFERHSRLRRLNLTDIAPRILTLTSYDESLSSSVLFLLSNTPVPVR